MKIKNVEWFDDLDEADNFVKYENIDDYEVIILWEDDFGDITFSNWVEDW